MNHATTKNTVVVHHKWDIMVDIGQFLNAMVDAMVEELPPSVTMVVSAKNSGTPILYPSPPRICRS